MDEKQSESRSSEHTDEHRTDTTSTRQSSGVLSNGGWTFGSQARYDPDEPRDLTTVVIGAVADAEDVPIVEVTNPPLYEVVDISGLDDALFGRPETSRNGTESSVEFRYNEYKVRVEADGWVTVLRRDGEATSDGEGAASERR